jgi:hypothetical protein
MGYYVPVAADLIKTVCAWCGVHLSGPERSTVISHGMCPECAKAVEAEIESLYAEHGGGD